MKTLTFLTMAIILTAAGAASAVKSLAPGLQATAFPQPATISIDEVQRQVDTRSLPELEIETLY